MDNILISSIIIYSLIIILVYFSKPDYIYDKNNNTFKEFGIENDKTIVTYPLLCAFIAIICYICCLLYNKFIN